MDWAALPRDMLGLIATSGVLSVQDLRNIRGTCREWRGAQPATGGQWLAMSRTRLDRGTVSASLWAISKAVEGELIPVQARLPAASSCWGGAWGSLAMRDIDDELFRHWPVGGYQEILPQMPEGMEPEGFFQRPPKHQGWPAWTVATHGIFGSHLFQHDDGSWKMAPVFLSIETVRSLCVKTLDIVYAAAYPNILVMDGPLLAWPSTSNVTLDGLKPWLKNGHHLFLLRGSLYLCILCHPEDDKNTTVALLFLISFVILGRCELSRRHTIGNNSLFLGANQPIICPSHEGFVGRRPNTIYIEHSDGDRRIPELLVIHLGTQDVTTIPFPHPLAEDIEQFGPACWVCPWAARQ